MNHHDILPQVQEIVAVLLQGKGAACEALDPARSLYEDGYGLDSMDTATLSAMLHEQFGADPYLSGEIPHNISEIVAYYQRTNA